MWPYWILFFLTAYMALTSRSLISENLIAKSQKEWPRQWKCAFIYIVLMIGLRYEVGGDWYAYIEMLQSYYDGTSDQHGFQDLGLVFVSKISVLIGSDIYLLNLVCAFIFTWGLVKFCLSQPLPWLALVSAVPYLITVVAMGYTRQAAAIGFSMFAMDALSKGGKIKFFMWIVLGCLFHKTCVILAPLAALSNTKNKLMSVIWISLGTLILYILFLQESIDFLISGYIEANYQSSGAGVRISMNALPAIFFLIFRKRFYLNKQQHIFWISMAISSVLMVPMLFVSPSTTVVDRIGLYFIPIQIFVLSRLPIILVDKITMRKYLIILLVIYNFLVLYIWLIFAETSFSWIPYRFYPWELVVKAF